MADVLMPQMGESIVEGTLTRWLKKIGDAVERDEPLFEISTDKVDTEIPSPSAGTLSEVLVEEGKTVGINTVVARIQESGNGAAPSAAPAASAKAQPVPEEEAPAKVEATPVQPKVEAAPAPAQETAAQDPAGPLSPLVRKMARENNIDLAKVQGSGAGGRITKQDLEAYMAEQKAPTQAAPAPTAPAPTAAPSAPAPAPAAPAPVAKAPDTPKPFTPPAPAVGPKTRIEPLSNMRQKIAEHMVMSKRTSPHVTTVHRADMTKVARTRAKHKEMFQQQYGMSLTFLPFVVRAAVVALREFPLVNASIDGTNIIYHNEANIGIAVALENGLIVPVIRNADEKNVLGLQRSIVDLAARARSRQLKPDEVQGGTFSITNFGSFGSLFATPVINQPQVAILGIGAVEKVPVVVDDAIAIRSQAYLALTFDHRLIDGALADQFTAKVKQVLEGWSEEVLLAGACVIAEPFKQYSANALRQYTERIGICLGKLSDEQIWARGHETENSVGNLCLHLAGNIRQWVVSGVGGAPDRRDRDSEFAAKGGFGKEQLLARLNSAVEEVCAVIDGLTEQRLAETVHPQGYDLTVLEAVYHIVEHFAYHAGQILFVTKAITGEDLAFYRHLANNQSSDGEKHP